MQTLKLGKETGSVFNWMMGNNTTKPQVGKGATILLWTDRHACEVMSVSQDGKRVVIQEYIPERTDSFGMSESQQYKYEKLDGNDQVIVWKWGAWRREIKTVMFIEEYSKTIGREFWNSADHKQIYPNGNDAIVIEGKTELKTTYSKVNILFGEKRHYYDYSF